MRKQVCLEDDMNRLYGGKPAPSADKVEEFVGCSVSVRFGGVDLLVNEGTPLQHCIARVCNVEWAKRIRDALNAPNAPNQARSEAE